MSINYSNKSTFNYKLTADALTDDEYTWIADLISSPQILMEIDTYFYPVTLVDSTYEFSKNVFNKLKALEKSISTNTWHISGTIKIKEKYNKPGDVFLGVVHRLDRPTSGIIIFARTSKASLD